MNIIKAIIMLGAIIGDIVGSRFEFNPTNDYNFELFTDKCGFTDDTICTCAVADALLKGKNFGESIHEWCRLYPHPKGSYGGRFAQWVQSDDPKPYGSYGNGSAMRVSPVAWFYNDGKKVLDAAKETAACTHNHPEGIKGAQTVALTIHQARMMFRRDSFFPGKEELKELMGYATDFSSYNIDIRIEDVKNKFDETCQGTVPVALRIIYDSKGFEDAIRRAVSLGADADTLGAIVGSIAEAIWGIPEDIKVKALSFLDDRMKNLLFKWKNRNVKPKEDVLQRCSAYEIVMLVHELHKQGYEQLRLFAGMSPSGMSWRWHLYPKALMGGDNGFERHSGHIEFECLRSSTGESRPEGRDYIDVEQVLKEHAAFFEKAKGEDKAYVEWFQQIVEHAEKNDFPIAYCDYYSHDKWVFLLSNEELNCPPF